ncbi:MAG: transglutaminase domain-containing protein [Candidatus Marinimicrobia bacterium]|nr:transglutaminase domain-containing protein [Candidatus Neomarinimicrobiota bacterium]
MKKISQFIIPVSLLFISCATKQNAALEFDFQYKVHFQETGTIEAWIPLPQSGKFQTIENLRVDFIQPYRFEKDSVYGNLFLHIPPHDMTQPETLIIRFSVKRQEARAVPVQIGEADRSLFLQSFAKVPLDDQFVQIADSVTPQNGQAGRRLYNYIMDHMEYDKTGIGWGEGDALYACDIGKGNCTDYHSYYNALMRAKGIPARFSIGFPIPEGSAGVVNGYHCWAEYYQDGKGWVPVDISEADKYPEKEDYFFGRLDERRVKFTVGRDIPLPGGSTEDVVNYSIYPYVKVDGVPSLGYTKDFYFEVVEAD